MYSVRSQLHPQYGNVIEIAREDNGAFSTPLSAEQEARRAHQKWYQEKIMSRFLIDDQIFDITELEKWRHEEYQSLPKCQECGALLPLAEVFPHKYSGTDLFCSQNCSNSNFYRMVDHFNDYEECDL